MTAALRVDGLTKRYGKYVAISDLSFSVMAGELACLIGPNGAGKSTTMRTIAGLQVSDGGTIEIAGTPIHDAADAKRLCALTPQELSMFEYLTGEETLRIVGRIRGVSDDVLEGRIQHWLALTHLNNTRGRLVREFSGGMKRKLAVACAMVANPPLVLLDESFTGLDPESTRTLQDALRAYCDDGGAVLLSSHILDMVQSMADRVIIVSGGTQVGDYDSAGLKAVIPAEHPALTDLYLHATGLVEDVR